MRLKLFLLVVSFMFLVSCGSEEDNSEPPSELVDFEASAEIEKLWDVSIGDGSGQQYLKLYPLLLSERLIATDRNGVVQAININDGDRIWSIDLDVVVSGGVGGNEIYHAVTSRDGEVILLNSKDGNVKWRVNVSSEVLVPAEIVNNNLILRTVDGKIIALHIETGAQQWVYKRDVPALSLRGSSRLVTKGNKIFAGLDSGRLVALDNNGNPLFDSAVAIPRGKSELERIIDIDGDAVFRDNVLYIASYQGSVIAIDVRKGQLIWRRKLSTYTGVEVAGSGVFSSDEHDHLWALDNNNGATLWKMDKLSARQITKPVAMEDAIVVGDSQGYLHWVSQYDGRFLVRVESDGSGFIVPPLVKGDRLYVLSRDGELIAYQYKKL
ncbi:MAG: outer membrane protein assembly factor BamB [Gammaproteobacteria bacterium]|nr:outer membrane protein assembly factor BamB [Gammaproteobacteria bacterium]MCW8911454.1 outer membrane protein assembly factor BamB [Gammaproteobacteria bacterium]MCW9003767.1 outer membrane protein assembly factor BamB [Gammaproteobacteria bacterium]